MIKTIDRKRVFFAFEAAAAWPERLPNGRLVDASSRHLTLVFLGDILYPDLEKILPSVPKPPIKVGLTGKFDRCLFLPSKRPNVVAWHVHWFDEADLDAYQKQVAEWLEDNHFTVRLNPEGFLPHVTLSRRPFKYQEWREAFKVLPVYIKDIHLYESAGGLRYVPLWTHQLIAPFTLEKSEPGLEIEVRAETLTQLFYHLLTALAFPYPQILPRMGEKTTIQDFSEITPNVSEILEKTDRISTLPFREIISVNDPEKDDEGILHWKVRISKI